MSQPTVSSSNPREEAPMSQAHQIIPSVPKSVALVDLSYLFRLEWHAQAEDSEINTAPRKVLGRLERIRSQVEHLIVCADSPPYARKEMDPQYKATREPPSEGLKAAFKWLKARIDTDGYQLAASPTCEADDIIATLACAYAKLGVADIRIVGSDKDLMALVDGPIRAFVPAVGDPDKGGRVEQLLDGPAVFAKYGVAPTMMPEYLTLCGDKSDNIPGCPGVGAVNAALLVNSFATVQMAISAARRGEAEIKPKIREALVANADRLLLSRKLIELRRDVELDVMGLLEKRLPKNLVAVDAAFEEEETVEEDKPVDTGKHDKVISGEPVREMPKGPAKTTAAIAKTHPANDIERYGVVDHNMQPQDLKSLELIAAYFVNGRQSGKFPTLAGAIACIIRGRELGMTAAASLDSFHVIDGKPVASADTIQHLAEQDSNCEWFRIVSTTDEGCVYEVKHKKHPAPYQHTYTMAQAQKAGLARGANYLKHPAAMLRARCKSEVARIVFPGATRGIYCPEEMGVEREEHVA